MQNHIPGEFLKSASARLKIPNDLAVVQQVAEWTTEILRSFSIFPEEEILKLQMGLVEMLSNAVEHGNLEINHEEKAKWAIKEKNSYFAFVENRGNLSPYKDRKVTLEFSLSDEQVVYVITDEGAGFTMEEIPDPTADDKIDIPSGKGIHMTRQIFSDELRYNEKGNQVTIVKKLSKFH